jgi:hypothetical protein
MLSFPTSPTTGQVYSAPSGSTYTWDGTRWVGVANSTVGPTGPQGPTGPTGPQGPAGSNGTNGTNGTGSAVVIESGVVSYGGYGQAPNPIDIAVQTLVGRYSTISNDWSWWSGSSSYGPYLVAFSQFWQSRPDKGAGWSFIRIYWDARGGSVTPGQITWYIYGG